MAYVLKEIIDAYRVLNGSVFTCFLDASKAFDRVNHSILFVDDLSVALNACRGHGKVIINHLMYADDLVILAPYVAGLSKLLSICEIFGECNDIIFNQKKSASLYFISKMLKGAHLPNVYLNGVLVKQVDSVKYLGHFLTFELSDDRAYRYS